MKIIKINFIYIIVFILLLILPYYLFEGKLFLGGDDTRLLYSYPMFFLKNVAFFSWYNISTIGINVSGQYTIPFLILWSILEKLIGNKIIISYFAFSLPLILGFTFFKKFVKELFFLTDKDNYPVLLGSLFYILSPILIINQLFIFLTPAWLICIIPAMGFYYLRYVRTGNFKFIYISILLSIIFSFSLLAIPWIAGFILPLAIGMFIMLLFHIEYLIKFARRTIVFLFFTGLSQSYWLFGFLAPFVFVDNNTFTLKIVSKGFLDTFTPTIISTATGTIIYPLLNLFHRQIVFDFTWTLKKEFLNFFDATLFLNSIFLIVLAIGVFNYRKVLSKQNQIVFLFVLSSFLLSLYFFTVNIGPLKNLFILFGKIPGFVMFRNFYDKFAPGYVIFYALLLTVSLVIIKKRFSKKYQIIFIPFLLLIIINFTTVKSTVNAPLWTTKDVYKTITIPDEYLDLMKEIEMSISPTNNILSIPFGTSVYSVIKDDTLNNVYVGISPVKIFSGVNDISGSLSFNFGDEANDVDKFLSERNYSEFNKMLHKHNINYVLVTKNIPKQVLKSYIYNTNTITKQDTNFLKAITTQKIYSSKNGNYDLYKTKNTNTLIQSKNVFFKKINSVKYILYFKNFSGQQKLEFNDSFHTQWKLFIEENPNMVFCKSLVSKIKNSSECRSEFNYFSFNEMGFLFKKTLFDAKHMTRDGSTNIWELDSSYIKNNFDKRFYKTNRDGSIDFMTTLYFKPQLYFYYGLLSSFAVILFSTGYFLYDLHKRSKK